MINLGDVNFALGADDRALRASVRTLQQFGGAVDRVAVQATNSANATAAAYRKQEAAITSALNKTLSINQQMRKISGTERFVDQTTASFRQLNTYLTQGQRSAVEYQRAMERFRASTGSAVRGFKEYTEAVNSSTKATGFWNSASRVGQTTAVLWTGPLGGISTRLSAVTSLFSGTTAAMALFTTGALAVVYVGYKIAASLLDAGKQVNALEGQFQALTGNTSQAAGILEKVIKISRQTGQSVEVLAPAFAKFAIAADGTGASMAEVEKQFTVVASAATKLQLSTEQTEGIFRALEQMMSKGTVQAEELRGQLGDRLAGAVQIAARAMGVTTAELQKMMKAGELVTSGFLPKFIDELAKTLHIDSKPIDNYTASLNNMSTAWFQLRAEMEKQVGVTSHVMNAYKLVTFYLDGIRQVLHVLPEMFALVGDYAGVAADRITKYFEPLVTWFAGITKTIRAAWTEMFGAVTKDSNATWAYMVLIVKDAINQVLDIITNLGEAIPVMLGTVTAAIASITIEAVNTMIQKIVDGINWLSQKIGEAIPGMNTPITIKFDPIDNPFKDAFAAGSTEIKRIMEQEHDVLGDTQKAWEDYKKAVDEATKSRHQSERTKDDFIGTPFELDKAGKGPDPVEISEKERKALERKLEAMKSINDELERTNEEIEALGGTEDVLNSLNAQFKRDKEVEKYAKALRKAGVDTAFITQKTQELAAALKLRDDLMKEREAIIELRDTMADSFDSIGHGLVSALTEGEDGLKSFLSTLKNVVNDIIDTWIQLAILNPIKNYLFGTDEPTLKGGFLDFAKAIPGLGGGKEASSFGTAGGFMEMLTGTGTLRHTGGAGSSADNFVGDLKATSQNFEGSMQSWMQSIKDIESSGGNYSALGPITKSGDRAYGAYQMMGANVPSWSEKWLGERMTGSQILGNKDAQDKIFAGQFGSMEDKWGASGAANAWFTGSPTGSGSDILGTDSHGYVKMFEQGVQKYNAGLKSATETTGELAKSAGDASKGVGDFGSALSKFPAAPGGGSSSGGSFLGGAGSKAGNFGGFSLPSFDFMNAISPAATQFILGGGVGLFRGGGIVGSGRAGKRVHPSVFSGAAHFGSGGLIGDEVPIIAHRGERVLTKSQQRAGGGGGTVVNFQVVNNAPVKVSKQESTNADGSKNIIAIIDEMQADNISKSGTMSSRALGQRFGLKPAINRR